MHKFVVFYNGEPLKTYELDEPVINIGRLPENTISIANMGISRRHTKIEEDADRKYVLSDLNSLNGTYVNGKRVKKIALNSGDKITIGKYTILYEQIEPHNPDLSSRQSEQYTAKYNQQIAGEPQSPDSQSKTEKVENTAVLIETNKHVVYKLDKVILTVGSGENDDIFVSGFMIGEEQVSIEKQQDGFYIYAHKFMGKIKVNGKSIRSHLLQHKDRIEIGSSTFRFMENG